MPVDSSPQTLSLAIALTRFARAIELVQWSGTQLIALIVDRTRLSTRQRADLASLSITYGFAVAFA